MLRSLRSLRLSAFQLVSFSTASASFALAPPFWFRLFVNFAPFPEAVTLFFASRLSAVSLSSVGESSEWPRRRISGVPFPSSPAPFPKVHMLLFDFAARLKC